MKADLAVLKKIGFGVLLALVATVTTFVKITADVISLVSHEITMVSVGRLEKLSF